MAAAVHDLLSFGCHFHDVSIPYAWPCAAEIMSIAIEECFDDLDAPPERVTGAEVPMPYAANLEAAALPTVEHVVAAAKRLVGK